MRQFVKKGQIIYIIVSFGFSWAVALITYLNGGFQVFGKLAILPAYAYMCGPAVGALVCAYAYEKGRRVKALGVTGPINKYLPIAWAIALSILVIALLISWAGPGISPADPVQSNIAFSLRVFFWAPSLIGRSCCPKNWVGAVIFGTS